MDSEELRIKMLAALNVNREGRMFYHEAPSTASYACSKVAQEYFEEQLNEKIRQVQKIKAVNGIKGLVAKEDVISTLKEAKQSK